MYHKRKRNVYAVIALSICLAAIIAPVTAITFLSHSQKYHNIYAYGSFGGTSSTETVTASIDTSLSRYINLTAQLGTGEGGQGYSWITVTTNLTWIGSPDDSIKSVKNVHLAVYTRLDENYSSNGTHTLTIGVHCMANQSESTFPNDAIDHKEITVPSFNLGMSSYSYTFNCSNTAQ
jgi:hypothetical protein